jgi:purine-binding chemotaxis protein CheW
MKKINSAADFMPTSNEDKKILETRAQLLALKVAETALLVSTVDFIRFRLNQYNSFGIAFEYIKEVIQDIKVTPLPMVPPYIEGVTNYRGYLLPIINLNALFDIEADNKKTNSIIVIYDGRISMGVMASHIDGIEYFESHSLEAPLSIERKIKQIYIQGLHNGTIAILNVNKILLFCQEQLNSSNIT